MIHKTLSATLSLILSTTTLPALAALGGDTDSVQSDQTHMQATAQITGATNYSLHQLQLPSGTTVREYLTAAGTVFAVAWEGPELPDLQALLGNYYERYSTAAQQRTGRGPVTIAQPDLVVQSGGHMRSFVGRAYLPEQLPQGLAPAAIQ